MKTLGKTRERCRAFTLIEILVAAAATLAIAAAMLGLIHHAANSWSNISGKLSAAQQGNVALSQLKADFESALLRRDRGTWLAASIQPDQSSQGDAAVTWADWSTSTNTGRKPSGAIDSSGSLRLNPESGKVVEINRYRFGHAGVWLRMFCASSEANTLGAPRAISWQIVRHKVGGATNGRVRYGLFRSQVTTENTFAAGDEITAENYSTGSATSGAASTIRKPRLDLLIANDVVDFGVRFFRRENNGSLTLIFPAASDGTPRSADRHFLAGPNTSASATRYDFPDIAEVFLRVLTEEGAREIEALERNQTTSADWWSIAEKHSEIFTARIELRSAD